MRPITNEDIKVLGRIVNISTENVVADASQVYDSNLHKDQQWLNDYFNNKTGNATTSKYGIVRLAASKNDPDNNDVPTIKILRDAIQDAISFILEDPGNTLLDNLNSIKELADALNNDPSFWTWVRDQLALKANESDFRTLVSRVDDIDRRVTELEICCQQVREYMDQFSITWSPARGGSHVTISPSVLHAGRNTVTIDVEEDYAIQENLTQANIADYVDGMYGTVTLSDITVSNSGNITSFQLDFTDVRSNVEINAHIKKYGTVTVVVNDAHGTASPSVGQLSWNSSHVPSFWSTITPGSGYQISGSKFSVKDSNSIYLLTNESIATTGSHANKVGFGSTIGATPTDAFENYVIEVTLQQTPSATIIWDYESSDVNASNLPTSMQFGQTVTTTVTPKTQIGINAVKLELYVGHGWIDFSSTIQNALSYNSSTGQISISYNQDIQDLFDHVTESPYKTTIRITIDSYRYYTVTVNYNHSQVESTVDTDNIHGVYQYSFRLTPKTGYQIDSVAVTCEGHDITDQTNSYGSSTYDPSTGLVSINRPFYGNFVVTVISSAEGATPTYGTVTVSPDHGTASPATCQADGTSHTITITPASGYTTTGMTATSNNNDVSVSVAGDTITVTGTSSNNATISVVLPASTSYITDVSPASFEWVAGNTGDHGDKRVIAHVILPQQWSASLDLSQYVTVTLSDSTNFTYRLGSNVDENDSTKTKVEVGIWSTTNRDTDHTTLSASATIDYKENGATVETITVPLYKYGYPYVSWKATAPSQTGRTLTKDSDNEYTLTLSSGNKTSMSGNLAVVNLSAGLRYKGTSGAPSDSTANPRIYDYKNGAPSEAGTPACDIYSGQNIYQRSDSYDDTAQNYFATYISKNEYLTVEVYDANGTLLSNRVITDTNPASGGSHGIGGTTSGSDYTTALNGTDFKVALDYAYSLTLGQDPVKLYFLTNNASQNKYVVKINHYDHGTNANTGEFILNVEFDTPTWEFKVDIQSNIPGLKISEPGHSGDQALDIPYDMSHTNPLELSYHPNWNSQYIAYWGCAVTGVGVVDEHQNSPFIFDETGFSVILKDSNIVIDSVSFVDDGGNTLNLSGNEHYDASTGRVYIVDMSNINQSHTVSEFIPAIDLDQTPHIHIKVQAHTV